MSRTRKQAFAHWLINRNNDRGVAKLGGVIKAEDIIRVSEKENLGIQVKTFKADDTSKIAVKFSEKESYQELNLWLHNYLESCKQRLLESYSLCVDLLGDKKVAEFVSIDNVQSILNEKVEIPIVVEETKSVTKSEQSTGTMTEAERKRFLSLTPEQQLEEIVIHRSK